MPKIYADKRTPQTAKPKPASKVKATTPKSGGAWDGIAKVTKVGKPRSGPKGQARPPQAQVQGKKVVTVFKDVYPGSNFIPLDSVTVPALLAAISTTGNLTLSCSRLNINRLSVYHHMRDDENFRKEVHAAQSLGVMGWEDEAARRAFEGYERPIYQQGLWVGSERMYSDTLALALLKAAKPEKYKDRIANEHSVAGGSQLKAYADKTDDELNTIINNKLALLGAVNKARKKGEVVDV